ncbi:MAG: ankyrin [Faunusvirus sp.]|jgi:ankyrin repeat protein|uniref:Ankyrin n=1 Tax=Faunusvirus sp. TaxID=2487766 RepID=A0A3G4ZXJ9_9VIRU|nr:MAG: ankyrin [Faunusvirus sp.]
MSAKYQKLYDLIRSNNAVECCQYIDTHKLNYNINYFGETPLMIACMYGSGIIANKLIEHGADVNMEIGNLCALYYCMIYNNQNCATIVINATKNIDQIYDHGYTQLHYACEYRRSDLVNMLIDRGADVNIQDKHGETALIKSCRTALDIQIIDKLLAVDAKLNLQDSVGNTALITACYYSYSDNYIPVVNRLIDVGADIHIKNNAMENVLIITYQRNYVKLATRLIDRGADFVALLNYSGRVVNGQVASRIRYKYIQYIQNLRSQDVTNNMFKLFDINGIINIVCIYII